MPKTDARVRPTEELTNWQMAVLALYALGGATSPLHGEDVAMKCYEMAPRRFGWEKHRQYPHLERACAALRDAKKEKNGALVSGTETKGWLLTKEGLAWCEENAAVLGAGVLRSGMSSLPKAEVRVLRELEAHRLFAQWKRGEREMSRYEVADALGYPADAPRDAVRVRLDALIGAAHIAKMGEMERFLEWLELTVVS